MPRNTPLRNRVKELRERLNIRQSELSREAGVTRQTIIAIEKGRLNPSILICLKIAKMLREPVDYIFYLQPGFDYEQEARENANRPKRGRKKRVPAAPVSEPEPAPAEAVSSEVREVTVSDLDEIDVPVTAVEREDANQVEPAAESSEPEAPDKPTGEGEQKPDAQDAGQAIWDFF